MTWQILLCALGILGGGYGIIYTFSPAGDRLGNTGLYGLLLSISLVAGSGLYGASLLLP